MTLLIERVMHNGKILAIIVRANAINNLEKKGENLSFVSPDHFPFQLGIHSRKKGEIIKPHFHLPFEQLTNFPVQEFFHVVSGKVKVDLYDDQENDAKVSETIITTGDTIILNTGHGFTLMEDSKLMEIKQGPYRGKEQEKRFIN